jgi:transglutaminase-like putative cysteine protease
MRRALIVGLAVIFAVAAEAQKPPIKFGDVPIEQLKMKRYEKDTSAAAVVLADYGESMIDYSNSDGRFIVKFDRVKRIKILNKDGYEWGNFSIPLFNEGSKEEELQSLKAITYNMEGTKVVETKMKSDAVFKEKTDRNLTMVKVALPNVKEGSVVEISYRITSPFIYNFQDWDFQTTIPTMWSEYRTRIPEYFTYKKFMQGYLGITVNESKSEYKAFNITGREQVSNVRTQAVNERIDYSENFNRLAIQDVPAFKAEPFITTHQNYISGINFELSVVNIPGSNLRTYNNSWEDLNEDFLKDESFGGVVRGSNFLKDQVELLTAGTTDPKEKIAALYSYVKNSIEWDGQYRKYSDENLKRVLENKKGSSAEINLMLVSMLQKAGIAANPVLISTRDHGFVRRETSSSSQFNYVIAAAEVDGKMILLDATDRTLPISVLPVRCLNGEGFMVSPTKPGWVPLSTSKSKSTALAELVLADDGTMKGKIQFSHDGYYGQSARKKYFRNGKDEYVNSMKSANQWDIETSSFDNVEKLSEPMKEVYELKMNEHVQVAGGNMYINPIFINRIESNPFQSETRAYPVDYGSPEEQLYIVKITIPEGWAVEELPAPKAFVLPANSARYVYNTTQNGNVISLTSQLVINKALFAHDEYKPLRDFYIQVVAKQAEQIVLKKK